MKKTSLLLLTMVISSAKSANTTAVIPTNFTPHQNHVFCAFLGTVFACNNDQNTTFTHRKKINAHTLHHKETQAQRSKEVHRLGRTIHNNNRHQSVKYHYNQHSQNHNRRTRTRKKNLR